MLVKEDTRRLARIVRVTDVKPIPKADRLEVAVVDGWECVVQKGTFGPGSTGLYFEIDAAIALDSPVFKEFDTQYLRKTLDEAIGKEYAVIKTIRLRGQLSQGLLLPAKYFPGAILTPSDVGLNVTNDLEVLKYVSPAEAKLFYAESESISPDASNTKKLIWRLRAWLMQGIIVDGLQPWPAGHVKSEEERVQNIPQFYRQMVEEEDEGELSVKLDGESATFYTDLDTKKIGVAQRNYSLRTEDVLYTKKESLRVYLSDWVRFIGRKLAGGTCAFPKWKTRYHAQSVPLVSYFKRNLIEDRMQMFNESMSPRFRCEGWPFPFMDGKVLALQGEMVGPDFNGNAENIAVNTFFIYRAYANGNQRLTPEQTEQIANYLQMEYIPVIEKRMKLPKDMSDMLKLADGPAALSKGIREGVVVKSHKTGFSFKVISNKWLEKKGK